MHVLQHESGRFYAIQGHDPHVAFGAATMTVWRTREIATKTAAMLTADAGRGAYTAVEFASVQVAAQDVKPGAIVRSHGFLWRVLENRSDLQGNTGSQMRHILVCDALSDETPIGYRKGMTLGYLPTANVDVIAVAK